METDARSERVMHAKDRKLTKISDALREVEDEALMNDHADVLLRLIQLIRPDPAEALPLIAVVAAKAVALSSREEYWEKNAKTLGENIVECLNNLELLQVN